MRTSSTLYAGIAIMAISLNAHAFPGESIVRDPVTGNYTITYVGDAKANTLSQTTFVPSTKITPAIRSSFHLGERGVITYRYTVSNGAAAKQSIVSFASEQIANPVLGEIPDPTSRPNLTRADLDAYVAAEAAALASPNGWDGSINRDEFDIVWVPKNGKLETNSIHPGQTLSGFGFNSLDLPGMSTSRMAGLVGVNDIFGYPDEGPEDKSAVLDELNRLRDNDFIRRNAAVPSIAVPDPFDAAVLLDRIRTHMATWSGKQLVDPAFAAQLDRYLVAAADAYRLNNAKAGREHIEILRKVLAKEHRNMDHDDEDSDDAEERKAQTRFTIDRLAARVLDFDLRYVLKRTEHDHEEGDRKKGR